ncbi:aminotransferase class I/II-fold pyridoxal phosphate-dependent enzyme [Enemella sp. A6]|uniref:aminotransferase class I/II-fold pyridoxal phosphate-dependent enzyme n=1 Tax=Enemella sp. A6 TaxID=3440152 RepID=UPI003EBDC8BB
MASQRSQVPAFEVMTVLDKVASLRAAGREVISLCAGEPAQGAPADVRRRAAEVLTDGTPLGYSTTFGLHELRAAIAGHYRRWYSLDVDPANILITTGASGAFLVGFLAAFDHGDRVALTRPGYPAYRNILSSLGCTVVELDCGPEQHYRPTVEQLAAAHAEAPLAGFVLASPANPTGTMVSADDLAEIAAWCADNGVRLVSDEIYHGITADPSDPGACAWATDRSALVIESFSKFWGMTGWRLGWTLVPDDLRAAMDALAGNYALCAPVPAQHAAVEAFTEASYAEGFAAVADHARARQVVLDAAGELGWADIAPADGAFYVYADITPVLGGFADTRAWADALLEATGVAVTPGVDFDTVHGGTAVRLSLAAGESVLREAVGRILDFQAR